MSNAYGWVNMDLPEHRTYALSELERLYLITEELPIYKLKCERQERYIKELEQHVSLLQKTLDVVHKNRGRRCRGG